MSFQRIDPAAALELMQHENVMVVDIRDPASFASGHIAGATRLDNQSVEAFITGTDRNSPVLVCCYHGNASQQAAQFLANQGFERVYSLDGGFQGWRLAGHPED